MVIYLSWICLLATHTLICVTVSLPPGVRVWPRPLLVALPGLFCLPFCDVQTRSHSVVRENILCENCHPAKLTTITEKMCIYRIMGYFRVAKFSRFCLKTWGLFFADFNFRGRQRPRKIISILFRENSRVGGTTRLSLYRTTVRKENQPKYLKHNE